MFKKKKAQQLVMMGLKNIYVPNLQNQSREQYAELVVVWQRGKEQQNESTPIEVSNQFNDVDMQDTFYRVCKFKQNKKGFEPKWCEFILKQVLEQKDEKGRKKERVIDTIKYDMSRHLNTWIEPYQKEQKIEVGGIMTEFRVNHIDSQDPDNIIVLQFIDQGDKNLARLNIGLVEVCVKFQMTDANECKADVVNKSLMSTAGSIIEDGVLSQLIGETQSVQISQVDLMSDYRKSSYNRSIFKKGGITNTQIASQMYNQEIGNTQGDENQYGRTESDYIYKNTNEADQKINQYQRTDSDLVYQNPKEPIQQYRQSVIPEQNQYQARASVIPEKQNRYQPRMSVMPDQNWLPPNSFETEQNMSQPGLSVIPEKQYSLQELVDLIEEERSSGIYNDDLINVLVDTYFLQKDNNVDTTMIINNLQSETKDYHDELKQLSKQNFLIKNKSPGMENASKEAHDKIQRKHMQADETKLRSLNFNYGIIDQNMQQMIQLRQKMEELYSKYQEHEIEFQQKIEYTYQPPQYTPDDQECVYYPSNQDTQLDNYLNSINKTKVDNKQKPQVKKDMIEEALNRLIDKAFAEKGVQQVNHPPVLTKAGCKEFLQEIYVEKGFTNWNEGRFNVLYDRFQDDEDQPGSKRLVSGLDRGEFTKLVKRISQL